MRTLRLAAALLLALLAQPAAAEEELKVIELRHRPAHEVIPLVRPLLAPGDVLSGTGFKLIVRTSPKRLRDLETVLAQVDVGQRQWTLTVRQTIVRDRDGSRYSVSGEVKSGPDGRITIAGRPPPERGGSAAVSGSDAHARVDAETATTAARDERRQVLRVRDGARAYIRVGQSVPQVKSILALTRREFVVSQAVELSNVTSGFDVTPRSRGDAVHLEVTPRLARLDDPAIGLVTFQELSTTVAVKPGEWVDLGLLGGRSAEVRRAFLDGQDVREGERRTVLIRVE